MIPMLTRWGFWRPIGFPRVYGFVIARTGGFAMRGGGRGPEEVATAAALAEVWRTRLWAYVEDVSGARGLREPVITEAEAMAAMVGKAPREALDAFQRIVDGRLAVAAYWWPWSEAWGGEGRDAMTPDERTAETEFSDAPLPLSAGGRGHEAVCHRLGCPVVGRHVGACPPEVPA